MELEKEFGWEAGKFVTGESETPVELDFAYMYNVCHSLGLGFEIVNHNDIVDGWQNSVLYGGPTLNFRSDKWFVIANYLPQWANIKKTTAFPLSKVLDAHERNEARILVGISL